MATEKSKTRRDRPRRPRALVLGLDGLEPSLVRRYVAQGLLPTFAALMRDGGFGELRSTEPPTTFPAWTSFFTGATPSSHGVPDFTVRTGYRVRFVGAHRRALPTVFEHLESSGLTVGAAWFPVTYPPLPLNGYHISGWDSPVTTAGDGTFVHPRRLHEELNRLFDGAHLDFDPLDEFNLDKGGDPAGHLLAGISRKTDIALHLLREHPVDAAMFYFGEADTAAHHFWAYHDETSPRRPEAFAPGLDAVIRRTYEALDRAVGRLIDASDPEIVLILSDHGSGGSSDLAIHLNRVLERAGLLTFAPPPLLRAGAARIRGDLVAMLPRSLRRPLFRLAGGLAPSIAESRIRFGGIDWRRTRAFSEEISYAPGVWLNQLGREPQGTVPYRRREETLDEAAEALRTVRSPSGEALVAEVVRREEIHRGPRVNLFPDLVIRLARPSGHLPVCMPSSGRPGPEVVRLEGDELLGKKGRSMPGCHTHEGVFFARGPGIPPGSSLSGAGIEDVAPSLCALMDIPAAPWFEGRPPGIISTGRSAEVDPQEVPIRDARSYTAAEERLVAERLRRLGYLEE